MGPLSPTFTLRELLPPWPSPPTPMPLLLLPMLLTPLSTVPIPSVWSPPCRLPLPSRASKPYIMCLSRTLDFIQKRNLRRFECQKKETNKRMTQRRFSTTTCFDHIGLLESQFVMFRVLL